MHMMSLPYTCFCFDLPAPGSGTCYFQGFVPHGVRQLNFKWFRYARLLWVYFSLLPVRMGFILSHEVCCLKIPLSEIPVIWRARSDGVCKPPQSTWSTLRLIPLWTQNLNPNRLASSSMLISSQIIITQDVGRLGLSRQQPCIIGDLFRWIRILYSPSCEMFWSPIVLSVQKPCLFFVHWFWTKISH